MRHDSRLEAIFNDAARQVSFGFSEAWTQASAGDFPCEALTRHGMVWCLMKRSWALLGSNLTRDNLARWRAAGACGPRSTSGAAFFFFPSGRLSPCLQKSRRSTASEAVILHCLWRPACQSRVAAGRLGASGGWRLAAWLALEWMPLCSTLLSQHDGACHGTCGRSFHSHFLPR